MGTIIGRFLTALNSSRMTGNRQIMQHSDERTSEVLAAIRQSERACESSLATTGLPSIRLAVASRPSGIYEQPHTSAKRLARIPALTILIVLSCEGSWCRVEYRDAVSGVEQQGWIHKPRISMLDGRP